MRHQAMVYDQTPVPCQQFQAIRSRLTELPFLWRTFSSVSLNLVAKVRSIRGARLARASALHSEDLQHGAVLGGVPVVNPFLTT